jgi:hypothetical protein
MAPERFFGAAASTATDVYELAVVFYAMVSGRLPWSNVADPAARLNPPRPSELGHALPEQLETVLLQALSTRAEARPPSVAELARRMGEAAGGSPAPRHTEDLPPAPPPVATAPAAAPRRRMRAVLLVAGFAAATALAVVLVVILAPADDPPAPLAVPAPDPSPSPGPISLVDPPPMWERSAPATDWNHALALHPKDSIALVGISVKTLRDSKVVTAALEDQKEGDIGRYLAIYDAACGFDVLGSIDRVLIGAANDRDIQLDVSVTGRFTRTQVEACLGRIFADEDAGAVTRRGAVSKLVSDKQTVWIGWPDDHTVFLSTRKGIDEAWMKGRLRKASSVRQAQALISLLDQVDTGAALWFIAAPAEPGDAPLPGTKPPRSIFASLRLASDLQLHAGLRYDSPADAEQMARALASQLEGFRREPLAAMWLKDAGFGVRGSDAILTVSMDHAMAVITLKGLLEQIKAAQ